MTRLTLVLILSQELVAYKIVNLSKGPGIIPVRVQSAYVINKYYTYLQSVNLTLLHDELKTFNSMLSLANPKFSSKTYNDTLKSHVSLSQIGILKAHLAYAQDKLDYLFLKLYFTA